MGSQEFCIDGGSPGASNRLSERGEIGRAHV